MLFNFSKKSYIPKTTVLRPPLFNVAKHWLLTLCVAVSILLITGIIGAKLFYYGYSEAYKAKAISGPSDPLNANYLKSVVGQRNSVLTSPAVLPRDPSI
jgi:hypothetical protein